MPELEPIFARQEQSVVYLFSRYWEKIPEFTNKRISDIQCRFPDASMENATGADEAIEFEYALSSFNHYGPEDRKTLKEYKSLYIVYWEQDRDEEDFARETKIALRFPGKVQCVCLKKYFRAFVGAEESGLRAWWLFRPTRTVAEPYRFTVIDEETKMLADSGAIERLDLPDDRLYRTIGFDKRRAECIECGHWSRIHLFPTTTRFSRDKIPHRLLFKPSGCNYFWGYFDVAEAFRIKKADETMESYLRRHYFWSDASWYKRNKFVFFVYRKFRELTYEEGKALFDYLERMGVRTDIRGSRVVADKRQILQIDRIIRA